MGIIGAFVYLNLLDVALTSHLLEIGGVEVSPLMQNAHWIPLKLGLVVVVVLAFRRWTAVMRGLVVGMAAVVAWNAAMLVLT